jgi:uncharacterized protein
MIDLFEWDSRKAEVNRAKHGVRFSDAVTIFDDPRALTIEEQDIHREERSITVGMDALGRVLVVVYAFRDDRIRIISARKANEYERAEYEKG